MMVFGGLGGLASAAAASFAAAGGRPGPSEAVAERPGRHRWGHAVCKGMFIGTPKREPKKISRDMLGI